MIPFVFFYVLNGLWVFAPYLAMAVAVWLVCAVAFGRRAAR